MTSRRKREVQYNRSGISINEHMDLRPLIVAGAEDPFEGVKWDPRFDKEPRERIA